MSTNAVLLSGMQQNRYSGVGVPVWGGAGNSLYGPGTPFPVHSGQQHHDQDRAQYCTPAPLDAQMPNVQQLQQEEYERDTQEKCRTR